MRNFTVNLGKATWQVPAWAQLPVIVLCLPGIAVMLVALILCLPAIFVGALVGKRVY